MSSWREDRAAQFYPKADAAIVGVSSPEAETVRPVPGAVLEACRSAGLVVTGVEPIVPAGTLHALFRGVESGGRGVVVKCGLAESTRASLAIEAGLSAVLVDGAVPHARVLAADVTDTHVPFPFIIMRDVRGEPLTALDGDEARLMEAIEPYALALRTTHGIGGRGFGLLLGVESSVPWAASAQWWSYLRSRLDDHCSTLLGSGVITGDQRASITSVFEHAPAELATTLVPRLLHGDCGMHNVMYHDPRDAVLIDWEDALLGDPLFEVAQWATFQPRRRWDAFFRSYFGHHWTPDALFWTYFLRIALAKQVVRLRFGYQDLPGRTPSAERIFTALDHLAP